MNKKSSIKILILGHTFNNGSAGITMRTLFSNWPKEQLICANHGEENNSMRHFKTYYCMGNKELLVRFPFSVFYKVRMRSRVIECQDNICETKTICVTSKRRYYYEKIVSPILKLLKIYLFRLKYYLSKELSQWLVQENPNIVYAVLGSLEDCRLLSSVAKALPESKFIVHLLDDWMNVVPSQTIIPCIYKKQINRELRDIYSRASLCLSISDYMSEEYEKRYGRKFISFHNPVDIISFDNVKRILNNSGVITVTYIGRVDKDNCDVINDTIRAIDLLNAEQCNFIFTIYTNANTKKSFIESHINRSNYLKILPYVEHNKIAEILVNQSDILLLPSSFKRKSIEYVKLSISTKLTEYLATRRPVVIYAPAEIAISKFCLDNNCAIVVPKRDINLLKNNLLQAVSDDNGVRDKINNGYNLIRAKYSKKYICEEFDKLLLSI